MHELEAMFLESLTTRLDRSGLQNAAQWTEHYRVMGPPFAGPWQWRRHPWIRKPHESIHPHRCSMKGAQMAWTEWGLNESFYVIDILGQSVLYVLPATRPDAMDFSSARFDVALELSDHLSTLFSDTSNTGLKRAGAACLYVRGSRSKSQLKSIPVDMVIFDEYDEMVQANIPLARERMSGRMIKREIDISTPTIPGYGIAAVFADSDQQEFMHRCPHCSKITCLRYPECLVITAEDVTDPAIMNSYLICAECKHQLCHETKPEWLSYPDKSMWVPQRNQANIEGYHVSQMYSITIHPSEIAIKHLRGLDDPIEAQELHNHKLGLPYKPEGASVLESELIKARRAYEMYHRADKEWVVTMGVDIGKKIHVEIDQWFRDPEYKFDVNDPNMSLYPKILRVAELDDFEELDALWALFKPNFTCIDANPDHRKAWEFAVRHYGLVRLVYYTRSATRRALTQSPDEEHSISVNRTSWMDLALLRYRREKIRIPMNLPRKYSEHLQSPARIMKRDADGNPIATWLSGSPDHWAHARTYAEIALRGAFEYGTVEDITKAI